MGYTIAAFLLCSTLFYPDAASYEGLDEDLTFDIVFNEETLNLSQNPPAVTFQGWVNFSDYVLAPITVHLSMSSDLGCVYLSQYDFTFQTPESIPYTGLITMEVDENSTQTFALDLHGTVEQAGIQYDMGSMSRIIPAYYWEEEQEVVAPAKSEKAHDTLFIFALPFLLVFLGVYMTLIRPKLRKYVQNNNLLSDK